MIGIGDTPPGPQGSEEFRGEGMMVAMDGQVVFFRKGAGAVRVTGTAGDIFRREYSGEWKLSQDIDTHAGRKRVEMPWPEPQYKGVNGVVLAVSNGFTDLFDCLDGKIDEPKNSGRKVAVALEVEIAIKLSSARGGVRIDLPLEDRSLDLKYDWHR